MRVDGARKERNACIIGIVLLRAGEDLDRIGYTVHLGEAIGFLQPGASVIRVASDCPIKDFYDRGEIAQEEAQYAPVDIVHSGCFSEDLILRVVNHDGFDLPLEKLVKIFIRKKGEFV
jgi:hypothetical protein